MDTHDLEALCIDYEQALRKMCKEVDGENFDNCQLMDEWMSSVKNEQLVAKRYFDNAHQKVQAGEAEKAKIRQNIDICQQEIDRRREEKMQVRKQLAFARKILDEMKARKESAFSCLQELQSCEDAIEEGASAIQVLQSTLTSYQERLGLEFRASGQDCSVIFTHLSPSDSSAIHRVDLKKQRATYKVTSQPSISVNKSQIDAVVKDNAWKEFLINVRGSFLSLYE